MRGKTGIYRPTLSQDEYTSIRNLPAEFSANRPRNALDRETMPPRRPQSGTDKNNRKSVKRTPTDRPVRGASKGPDEKANRNPRTPVKRTRTAFTVPEAL